MRMLAKDPADRPASAGELGREALALRALGPHRPRRDEGAASRCHGRSDRADRGLRAAADGTPTRATGPLRSVTRSRRDPDTDPGFLLPAVSRMPRWLPYAVALVLLALLVLVVAKACGGAGSDEAAPAAAGGTTVQVVADDYLGMPVRDARELPWRTSACASTPCAPREAARPVP